MTYSETISYLYAAAPMFQRVGGGAYKAGLETTLELAQLLGNPQRDFRSIHVGGTNGKGSVSQMLASVLQAAGLRVGLYTSPHLRDFRERMVVNGEQISEPEVVDFITKLRPEIERLSPSFFEITTAMTFDFFRRREVDIAVVEVGLGGRLDCTNILAPMLSVITNISLDHTQFLGDTLPKIAAEKAGIIKTETPVVVGEFQPETAPVFIARARELQAPLRFANQCYRCSGHRGGLFDVEDLHQGHQFSLQLGMEGDYQGLNLSTALSALDILAGQLPLTEAVVREGLASACVPGRWQCIGTEPCSILVDTGHNSAGIRWVVNQLLRQPHEKLYFVLGVVEDKELSTLLPLLPTEAYYLFTQASLPRALPAKQLAEKALATGLRGEVVPTVSEALTRARTLATSADLIFVGGSTFTVAEVL